MSEPKAYGTFVKKGNDLHRLSAFIQWGESEQSIGSCLLLNPGSADFLDPGLVNRLSQEGKVVGELKLDPTMCQLVSFIHEIYNGQAEGRFHIYNLFTLHNPRSVHAIEWFEELSQKGEITGEDFLVSQQELSIHPWLLLGWGCEHRASWTYFIRLKEMWKRQIEHSGIKALGKKHPRQDDYYHPCPLIPTKRPEIIKELVQIYHEVFKGTDCLSIQRFPFHAAQPNMIVESAPIELEEEVGVEGGWVISPSNPEWIVNGFSHLRIKNGYKLRGYQYLDGIGGNGIVWAIPTEEELPNPMHCKTSEEYFLSPPKPLFALTDYMEAIAGDQTPLSYLQAAIVYHELSEFGAYGHGISWRNHVILPIPKNETGKGHRGERGWNMLEEEPEIWEPHFFYSEQGKPTVIFYTYSNIGTELITKFIHTFAVNGYIQEVEQCVIAEGGPGIIF